MPRMDDQQYALSWNYFHKNLTSGFQSLLQEQDLVDVTLAVDGKYFKAHKMVLSVCSSYFKELFHVTPCKHPIVMLQDVQYQVMQSMLLFMYQGEVKINQEDLAAFIRLAEMLRVKGLTEMDGHNVGMEESLKSVTQDQEMSTNGVYPPSYVINDQLTPHWRPVGSQIFRSTTPPPSTSTRATHTAQTTTPPKKLKLSAATRPECDAQPEARSQSLSPAQSASTQDKKSKASAILAIRLEALQALQKSLAQEQQRKGVQKQPTSAVSLAGRYNHQVQIRPTAGNAGQSELIVKEEPVEQPNEACDETMDVSTAVATSLVDEANGNEDVGGVDMERGEMTEGGDACTPGRATLLTSRRGLPVLIHDGHIYTRHRVEPARTLWLCVKQRTLRCGAHLATGARQLDVLSLSAHNHRQLHDVIRRLQAGGGALGSGSSNCGSSSNSSPTHSHDRHDFPPEPTDLSVAAAQSPHS